MKQIRVALVGGKLGTWVKRVSEEPGFLFCGYFDDINKAIDGLPAIYADVVLLGIQLSKAGTGIDCLKKVRKYCSSTQFMMLTDNAEQQFILEAFKAGASGYILKSSTAEAVTNAIREIHQGGSPLSPEISRKLVGYFNNNIYQSTDYHLTEEERLILKLLKSGISNKEIGIQLFENEIPENIDFTHRMRLYENFENRVKQRVYKIYKKIDVGKRTQAIDILERLPAESFNDTLANLLSYMKNYTYNLFSNIIDCTFHAPASHAIPAIELSEYKIQYVFNAFKAILSHILTCAGAKGVIISVYVENNKVLVTVYSGGESADAGQIHTLKTCLEDYMKAVGGSFVLKKNRISGKEVILEIPF